VLGWVELTGLRCQGRHGVYPEEQASPRLFLVDLAVRTDIGQAAASDDLNDALDLAGLAETVREVIGGPSRKLLETLGMQSAQALLRRFPQAEEVRLRVRKPDPPGIDAAEEAVSVELTRAMLAD
jgi:7,8-dihydroneopterin aldolase/epimerase/oxygenase